MNINFKTIQFLSDLKENNTRQWFTDNKAKYEEAKQNIEDIIGYLIYKISEFDKDITNLESKDCQFRIHKDVRFSKDKTPYKTNFGLYYVRDGKKSPYAGYYLHLEPTNNFIACGVYAPTPEILKKIKTAVSDDSFSFLNLIKEDNFIKTFGEVQGEKLKNSPKNFAHAPEVADYMKLKQFIVIHNFTDAEIYEEHFFDNVLNIFKTAQNFGSV